MTAETSAASGKRGRRGDERNDTIRFVSRESYLSSVCLSYVLISFSVATCPRRDATATSTGINNTVPLDWIGFPQLSVAVALSPSYTSHNAATNNAYCR